MSKRRKASLRSVVTRVLGAAVATACTVLVLGPAQHASAGTGPALGTSKADLAAALHCPSSFTHTDRSPVLLVHGMSSTFDESWSWNMAPALRADGYDVCGVDLPNRAMSDIQISAEYVVNAVRTMQAATGNKVDVISHSEGTATSRWAAKWWPDVQGDIDDLITLASPTHGIGYGNLYCIVNCAPSVSQVAIGAKFVDALNRDDETPGAISYTNVYSLSDEAIVPATTNPMSGADNVLLQGVCPGRVVTHGGLLYDSVSYQLVLDALSHPGGADPSRLPIGKCFGVYLPGVTDGEVTTHSASMAATLTDQVLNYPHVVSEPPLKAYAQ
ncbi:esterase/lipase family protein [Streptomyces sp. bgisy031]|uniref:esterase/lipase family protein n=1 Tax=Streptomyces sp. bgisy031 TaxID=3413772 RepID=UPI003D740711